MFSTSARAAARRLRQTSGAGRALANFTRSHASRNALELGPRLTAPRPRRPRQPGPPPRRLIISRAHMAIPALDDKRRRMSRQLDVVLLEAGPAPRSGEVTSESVQRGVARSRAADSTGPPREEPSSGRSVLRARRRQPTIQRSRGQAPPRPPPRAASTKHSCAGCRAVPSDGANVAVPRRAPRVTTADGDGRRWPTRSRHGAGRESATSTAKLGKLELAQLEGGHLENSTAVVVPRPSVAVGRVHALERERLERIQRRAGRATRTEVRGGSVLDRDGQAQRHLVAHGGSSWSSSATRIATGGRGLPALRPGCEALAA